jgi:anti-anti-sigma regulatory factor
LHNTASTRAAIRLDGMLFFGNAEDLATRVKTLFQQADMIALDLRGVSDIDVTGAQILTSLVGTVRAKGKHLLFCGVPDSLSTIIRGILGPGTARALEIHQDLDAALEWMEERSLQADSAWRDNAEVLALRDIDFLSGLASSELDQVAAIVTRCEFAAGETICREGDEGDRMWLLAKGTVSVRLVSADGVTSQRIASLACGTTIGEMSLVDDGRRSATVVADEHVVAYVVLQRDYARLLSEYPAIAAKLLANLSLELARRLRRRNVA